jgi:hypothetical protein
MGLGLSHTTKLIATYDRESDELLEDEFVPSTLIFDPNALNDVLRKGFSLNGECTRIGKDTGRKHERKGNCLPIHIG